MYLKNVIHDKMMKREIYSITLQGAYVLHSWSLCLYFSSSGNKPSVQKLNIYF